MNRTREMERLVEKLGVYEGRLQRAQYRVERERASVERLVVTMEQERTRDEMRYIMEALEVKRESTGEVNTYWRS
jgi:hypothetical protein